MLTIFVDFGATFPGGDLTLTVGDLVSINGANLVGWGGDDPANPDPHDMDANTTLRFSPSAINWDYNANGGAPDQQDVDDFRNDVMLRVIDYLRITAEPVMLSSISAATDADYLDAINNLMNGHDTYVFMTDQFRTDYGATPVELGAHAGFRGVAPGRDGSTSAGPGVNNHDETVLICGAQLIPSPFPSEEARVNTVANVIAHEAAHAGGLPHTFDTSDQASDPTELKTTPFQSVSNVMSYSRERSERNIFTRYPLEVDFTNGDQGSQPTDRFTIYYEQITAGTSFGRATGVPEYVTDTGAHDLITISYVSPGVASVEVTAFADAARTTPLPVPQSATAAHNWFMAGYSITGTSNQTLRYNISTANGIDVFATSGADCIVIDAAIPAQFRVHGGAGSDVLQVRGNGSQTGTYTPDSADGGAGTITINGGATIHFDELEPVQVDGFANFTFVTPNSNDRLDVDSPAAGRNRISGTSGGVWFEAVTFFDVTNFTVDMGTNDGGSPGDSFTMKDGLVASGLSSFTVLGGPGNDTFSVKPSTTATINIHGGPPVIGQPGVPPGDVLAVDLIGVGNPSCPRNVPDGSVTSSTHQPVHFTSIETFIASDRFEVNDSIYQATVLGSDEWITLRDLSIHSISDVDFFRVTAHDTGRILINAIFDHEVGDLSMAVEDERGNVLALADSSDDNETLSIPVVRGEVYYVVVGSLVGGIGNYTLEIEQFPAPVPRGAFLDPLSDTGRSNADNVTNNSTPRVLVQADVLQFIDVNNNDTRDAQEILPLTAAQAAAGSTAGIAVEVWLANTTTGASIQGYANPLSLTAPVLYEITPAAELADGVYVVTAATRVFDGQRDEDGNPASANGRSPFSNPLLTFTVDTLAPYATFGHVLVANDGLAAESDSGVSGPANAATLADRVTSDTTPTFFGVAEANVIVQAWLDVDGDGAINVLVDAPIGESMAIPLDGNVYSEGYWKIASMLDMNDPRAVAAIDGLRRILIRAEDLAGNIAVFDPAEPDINPDMVLEIFIDTQGPQITGLHLPDNPLTPADERLYNLFSPKPTDGPTPPVTQLAIEVQDLPNRLGPDFLYAALVDNIAANPAHYVLIGDAVGVVPIQSVTYTQDPDPPADGAPALATITLTFAEPLPDDRYTLTISDTLVDPAGNRLDGESNATQPLDDPRFPSGDGQPGGAFVARFTVDSRPEIGVTAATRVYLDTNGNFIYDPAGSGDETNRDLIFQFGLVSDAYFAGNFNPAGLAPASGFDKLGAFGWDSFAGVYRFLLDFNHNGVASFYSPVPWLTRSALPVAGDFDPAHPGDEIGLFTGDTWYLDTNGNNILEPGVDAVIPTAMRGIPVVGDVNGDGFDDLITYDAGSDTFYIDLNRNGVVDDMIKFGIPDFVERPVIGDLNLDGVDDLGLWVAGNAQKIGEGKAEWYFLVSDRVTTPSNLASPLFDPYSPDPLGNDLFANFGDRYSLPIFGNFDPPVAGGDGASGGHLVSYTNAALPLDVNNDGLISPIDALLVINRLNASGATAVPDMMVEYEDLAPFVDVNADRILSPLDALLVINYLNRADAGGEGEGSEAGSIVVASAAESGLAGDSMPEMGAFAGVDRSDSSVGFEPAADSIGLAAPADPAESLLLVGQAADHRPAAGAAADEWLKGKDLDLEEILELVAEQVQSDWWES